MAFLTHQLPDDDHVLVHQYIRLFGRRPTPEQLTQYRTAKARVRHRLRFRVRRRTARVLTRL
jgi:hypothetical protein